MVNYYAIKDRVRVVFAQVAVINFHARRMRKLLLHEALLKAAFSGLDSLFMAVCNFIFQRRIHQNGNVVRYFTPSLIFVPSHSRRRRFINLLLATRLSTDKDSCYWRCLSSCTVTLLRDYQIVPVISGELLC